MVKPLRQFEKYDRKDVHDIFDPYSNFVPGTGTWGMQGIVKVPNREKDYVFFVTFGQKQADHSFDEEITADGILTWQSQPKQTLMHKQILDFINHNHLMDNIYLFLRTNRLDTMTKKAQPFTYLGQLAYVTHDIERQQPVHFKWQILDWDAEAALTSLDNLSLVPTSNDGIEVGEPPSLVNQLSFSDAPEPAERRGSNTRRFQGRHVNFAENTSKNKDLGLQGEELVLMWEKQFLIDAGRPDLAEKVTHTSVVEGDGAGYDIQSFSLSGELKYVEVKTTTGGEKTPFIMTINELAFSQKKPDNYVLYRLYDFNQRTNSAECYILSGDISLQRELVATQFKVY